MSESKASPAMESQQSEGEPAPLAENINELSQEDLAGLNGGTFVDDLIKAIENR